MDDGEDDDDAAILVLVVEAQAGFEGGGGSNDAQIDFLQCAPVQRRLIIESGAPYVPPVGVWSR